MKPTQIIRHWRNLYLNKRERLIFTSVERLRTLINFVRMLRPKIKFVVYYHREP